MGNKSQKEGGDNYVGDSPKAETIVEEPHSDQPVYSLEPENVSKKKKKSAKKEEKKKRKKFTVAIDKMPAEIQAMVNLDATDGNKEGQTIFTKLVHVNMVGSGVALRAAIVGRDGGDYAHSEQLVLTDKQIKAIAAMMHDPSPMAAEGITLDKEHFHYTSSKPSIVHGQSKTDPSTFCTVVSTRQLLLIGIYSKEKQEEAEDMMVALQSYFADQGI